MHLRQPDFTYIVCEPFTKNKKVKNFKETGVQDIFIQLNYIKLVFSMKKNFKNKNLNRRTAADKVLRDKAFNI